MTNAIKICFIALLFISCSSFADTSATKETEAPTQNLESWQHFVILVDTINTMRSNLESLRAEIGKLQLDQDKQQANKEIDQLILDLQSLNTALEMLATGGADLSLFGVKVDKPFDIKEELLSIFEPILVELRRLSERPRKIERLRSELLYFQQRLDVANEAVKNLTSYREQAPTPKLKEAFKSLEDRWKRRHDDLTNRVNLVQFELNQVLSPESKSKQDTLESLKNLFGGRLLNLFIAVIVMILTFALLSSLAKIYRRFILRDPERQRAFISRIGSLSFYLSTTLVVMLAGMSVFYVRGDWVLLGLFLIVIAGAAWAIQKSLPRFLTEAKLILNLGPVREGERIIYQNLPWKVASLNFSAVLQNPLLQGGTIQLPVRDLVNFNSRKFDQDESWFPSSQGDWVMLEDNTFGKVARQTPEQVEIITHGATKTYPVGNYLQNNPKNLSRNGFSLQLEFGLDYEYQPIITTTILDLLSTDLKEKMQTGTAGKFMQDFSVHFSKADASSLNFIAIVKYSGDAASFYREIPRLFQRYMIEICNQHQWNIPFNTLTVRTVNS